MPSVIRSPPLWAVISICHFHGSGAAAETCVPADETSMLQAVSQGGALSQKERLNELLQKSHLTAAEQLELAEIERSPPPADALKTRPAQAHARNHKIQHAPAMLFETGSSSESDVRTTHEVFENPEVWGPTAWFFLHSVALALGDEVDADKQERLRRFFTEDLAYLLPCPTCARSVQDHVSAMQIDDDTFASRDSAFEFVFDLHNMVNADKGVPEMDFNEAVLNYAQAFDQGITDLHFESFDQASRNFEAQAAQDS